jgi:hypothetical protein
MLLSRIRLRPLVYAPALCLIQIALTFPGTFVRDSLEQFEQATSHHYTDWHPPVMALVWSWLLRVTGQPGALLVLHQSLHWLGIGLIADGCYCAGKHVKAWILLITGAFPLFLFYDRYLLKDVGMASALIAGLGLIIWFLLQNRPVPWWATVLSGVCLLYGGLIRTNAVFAIGPIICLYVARIRTASTIKVIGYSAVIVVLAVPISNWINHRLIGAEPQDPVQSLQIFDLMGIAARTGDSAIAGAGAPDLDEIKLCYTSYWWDTMSPWGSCAELRPAMGYRLQLAPVSQQQVAATSRLWHSAILSHPLAYALHRLSYFNSSLYFLVPPFHFRFSKSAELGLHGPAPLSRKEIELDYVKRSFIFWPVLWLSIGVCTILLAPRATPGEPMPTIGRLLILSGVLYSAAYALIGVATDIRYYYWPTMAILVGCILASEDIDALIRDHSWRGRLALGSILLVVVLGYAARITDITFV